MTEKTSYEHGVFSWTDLSAADMGAAKAWYAELFGWDVSEQSPGDGPPYAMFMQGGKAVAGLGQLSDEMKAAGVRPTWNTYFTVDDVDAATKTVESLGGKVLVPPMKVNDAGWMAWFTDPEGAAFAVWKADQHIGAQVVNEPVSLCWNELNTRDPGKATEFYGAVAGWKVETMDMGPMKYSMFHVGDQHVGGMLEMTKEWGDMPAHWMVYLAVEDIEATVKKVEETGGKVCVPPTEIPPGTFSVIEDPQGGTVTVIQQNPES